MTRISGLLVGSLCFLAIAPVCASNVASSSVYLAPNFRAGERFDNVFSRAIAIRAVGFDDTVHRVSGSATYRVSDDASGQKDIQIAYRYDGLHEGTGRVDFRNGGAVSCFDNKCTPNTDASGLIYNPAQWGKPPAMLRVGQRWDVTIASPWELGTPGIQIVTVVAINPVAQSVTLMREGHGDGAYARDRLQTKINRGGKSYDVAIEPGRSYWYGYTTFQHGVVSSDELMVERPVTLVSHELGRIAAAERQYILLNAMPTPDSAVEEGNPR